MYMDMCFACIAAVLTNHRGWRIGPYKYKNCCVMHEINVFDRNVQFANCLSLSTIVLYSRDQQGKLWLP